MKKLLAYAAICSSALASVSINANANEFDDLTTALKSGTPYVDVRYRYEFVDQDNFDNDAKASTIRSIVGYETGEYRDFSAVLELENISAVGAEHYNDGGATASSSNHPVVADPVGTNLNQAYLTYSGLPDTQIKFGRQTVNRANHRFIGSVGWRQDDQTKDGVTITNKSIPDTELFYGYAYNVNRVFGDDDAVGDFNTELHMADATYKGIDFLKVMTYGYWLDIDSPSSQTGNSNATYGVNLSGNYEIKDGVKIHYHGEYAKQSDYGENTTDYDADYYHAQLGISAFGLTLKGGYEELGSDDGTASFRTPLATLHKFNGWADQFLATPANGLQDTYGMLIYKVSEVNPILDGTKIMLAYHDFSEDHGSNDYGDEWNFDISQKFKKHYSVGFRYANYDSTGEASAATNDVEKFTLSLGVKF